MSEPRSLLRILNFISLLAGAYKRTAKEYADHFEVDKSTISRYKRTLEEVGFVVHQNQDLQLYLDQEALRKQPHVSFTEGEAHLLSDLVRSYPSPLQQDLLNKIYICSPLPELAESTSRAQLSRCYRLIKEAISADRQLMLVQYVSVSGNDQRNRKVEPLRFIHQDTALEAYDVEKKAIRHFHLDRMTDVKCLNSPFRFKKYHYAQHTDPFRIADVEMVEVELELELSAAQQMKEAFPDTKAYLTAYGNKELYKGPVNARFLQLDRFLLSMCLEVKIMKPQSLKEHLENLWNQKTL
ncbi:helix-turn-helix transcriptional regulator [Catalinimonas niigatensis]|uniref:helix-turn-helix transcriptional regulator n=1 Tax=Catalinimonas niigatensis TaxID=1397264 RepID=UPI002665155D|nr:WYL domain-containing protein [Catalinimonas niigatensis]WPP51836.1 WYL domain-containing protein [Catalinimonas niigatensis]